MRLACLIATAAAVAMAACAGRPPETPSHDERATEPEPEAAQAPAPAPPEQASDDSNASASADRPPGDLVCRAVTTGGGATELFLKWDGNEARGVLRETAPSGMVHDKRVRAERQQGVVIADDVYEKDLVVHAAVVAERSGKKLMKVDDAWSTCE